MFDETLMTIAKAAVEANRTGDIEGLIANHYAPNVVSIEAAENPEMPRAAEGLEALHGKHAWWNSAMEEHSSQADGPYLFAPDRFAIHFSVDATNKQTGERMQMKEVGLYTVADGKIVREEFFWAIE